MPQQTVYYCRGGIVLDWSYNYSYYCPILTMYNSYRPLKELCWLVALCIISYIRLSHAGQTFPQLMDFARMTQRAHIVSEVLREGEPKYILEEHINFEISTERVVKTTLEDKDTLLIDGRTSAIFNFKPYNCQLLKRDDLLEKYNFTDVWSIDSTKTTILDKKSPLPTNGETVPFVGISAIWLNAASKFSIYTREGLYRYSWSLFYPNFKITLFFQDKNSVMHLDAIEGTEMESERLLFGINVIHLDFAAPKDEHKIFNLPVVYGCSQILKELGFSSIANDQHDGTLDKINIRSASSYEINMEVSATSYGNHYEMKTSTDILELVVAFASLDDLGTNPIDEDRTSVDVKLVHTRGFNDKTTPEMKEISDYTTGIKYTINMSTNECARQRLTWGRSQDSMKVTFKNNDVTLDIDDFFIEKLFEDSAGFILNSRWITPDKTTEYLYYERDEKDSDLISGCKQITISRTYSREYDPSDAKEGIRNRNRAELEVVKVIVYDDDRTRIEHVYLFMMTSYDVDLSFSERARLFDLSDCFSEVDQHKWISIRYPLDRENIPDLIDFFYEQQSNRRKLQLNFLRMPKIEQTYQDFYVVLRALLLDTQPDPLVGFDKIKGLSFMDNDEELHVAANVKLCSEICKMYNCHMFSYCLNNECRVTSRSESYSEAVKFDQSAGVAYSIKDSVIDRINRDRTCTLYIEYMDYGDKLNARHSNKLKMRPLNDILAQLSHDEYFLYHQSKENLVSDGSSSGSFLEHRESDMPDLSFSVPNFWAVKQKINPIMIKYGDRIVLMPSNFEIERDTLEELLSNNDDVSNGKQDDTIGAAFHDSIGRRRFKLLPKTHWKKQVETTSADNNNLEQQQESLLGSNDGKLIAISGQTYETCAILCIDRGQDCGSFSYCHFDRQCVTSGLHDRKSILASSMEESQCVIVQRDFLAKFSQLQETTPRPVYTDDMRERKLIKRIQAHDEHDCAHQCMIESDFNCLSFDYCDLNTQKKASLADISSSSSSSSSSGEQTKAATATDESGQDNNNVCFLQATRKLTSLSSVDSSDMVAKQQRSSIRFSPPTRLPCRRYQRSYLADFNRLDHRSLTEVQQQQLLVPITGINVDECASRCAENSKNCNVFQFCYKAQTSPHQICSIAMNGSATKLTTSSLLFESDCYIYTMKKDIATNAMFINSQSGGKQLNEQVLIDADNDDTATGNVNLLTQTTKLSVGAMLAITMATFIIGLTIGASIIIRERCKEQIEQRYRRFKILWFGVAH